MRARRSPEPRDAAPLTPAVFHILLALAAGMQGGHLKCAPAGPRVRDATGKVAA